MDKLEQCKPCAMRCSATPDRVIAQRLLRLYGLGPSARPQWPALRQITGLSEVLTQQSNLSAQLQSMLTHDAHISSIEFSSSNCWRQTTHTPETNFRYSKLRQ